MSAEDAPFAAIARAAPASAQTSVLSKALSGLPRAPRMAAAKTKLRITLVGPSGSGKTSFMFRAVQNIFPEYYDPTIGTVPCAG